MEVVARSLDRTIIRSRACKPRMSHHGLFVSPCNCRRPRERNTAANYNRTRRSRSALAMTDTELKLIAAAAIIGDSSNPKNG